MALEVPTDLPSANRLFHHTPVAARTSGKDVFTDTAGSDGGTICRNERMVTSAHDYGVLLSSNSHTHLDIYYQNVHGLRTKASELPAKVYSSKFHVICQTET